MEFSVDISLVFGGLISILLSVVAFFIKQLHRDFRKLEKEFIEVKAATMVIQSELKSHYQLVGEKVKALEKRVEHLELFNPGKNQ
ncbi:MAG: hypothetical protein GY705_07880 [Bacteroidetes bacterium]|nr:hypothetical protein [Bacteroidota bacterium]